jgi:CBS domain-containing protein
LALPISEYCIQVEIQNGEKTIQSHVLQKLKTHSGNKVVTCGPKDSFKSVIELFSGFQVHRVFIVDNLKRVQGIITLHDVMLQVMKDFMTEMQK